MDRRIDAHIARTQFGQLMDLAVDNNERFIVDRRGEPAVVIIADSLNQPNHVRIQASQVGH